MEYKPQNGRREFDLAGDLASQLEDWAPARSLGLWLALVTRALDSQTRSSENTVNVFRGTCARLRFRLAVEMREDLLIAHGSHSRLSISGTVGDKHL